MNSAKTGMTFPRFASSTNSLRVGVSWLVIYVARVTVCDFACLGLKRPVVTPGFIAIAGYKRLLHCLLPGRGIARGFSYHRVQARTRDETERRARGIGDDATP